MTDQSQNLSADKTPRDSLDSNPEVLDSIVEDFTSRLRSGEHPAIEEYQNKHPELKDEIEDLLASVAMIEQLKTAASMTPSPNRKSLDEVSKLAHIANYEILKEIGRGGMGVVFEAVHVSLGRRVAIKVMPTPLVNSEKYIRRFKREAKAAAKLHHTNIVGVFEVGEREGYHYYVMDFVDGQGLNEVVRGLRKQKDETIKSRSTLGNFPSTRIESTELPQQPSSKEDQPPSDGGSTEGAPKEESKSVYSTQSATSPKHFRWAARIGANLADALAYAHQSNILHRDIKPSNMILDRKGTVWITDFGLAKDISGEINLTKTGDVIGTPQYLAPESLEGEYDRRSEVYCLGLTLYELATLQPAYPNGSTAEVLRAIATTNPVSPRRINKKVPIDLSTIIDKAVERNPEKRYQTAEAMKNDLLAFIQDRPISARPPSTVENVWKWCRRKPMEAALSLTTASLLVLVMVYSLITYYRSTEQFYLEAERKNRLEVRTKEVERQRQKAESNIEFTLGAFDEMFRTIVSANANSSDKLDIDTFEELSGIETTVTKEDAEFLETLLGFYDEFATKNADNDALKQESARAFRRAANIYQLIGENERAAEAYKKSVELYEAVYNESPDSKETLIALVQTMNELSRHIRRNEDAQVAIQYNERAVKLLNILPVDQLDDDLKLELARTLNSLGSSLSIVLSGVASPNSSTQPNEFRASSRVIAEASKSSQRAVEIVDSLLAKSEDNPKYRAVRANCYSSLAASLRLIEPQKAFKMRKQAIEEFEELIEENKTNSTYRFRLAVAYSLNSSLDTAEDELVMLGKSVAIARDLQNQFPLFLDYRQLYGSVCTKLSSRLIAKQELIPALELLEDASEAFEYVVDNSPNKRGYRGIFVRVHGHCIDLINAASQNDMNELADQTKQLAARVKSNFDVSPRRTNEN